MESDLMSSTPLFTVDARFRWCADISRRFWLKSSERDEQLIIFHRPPSTRFIVTSPKIFFVGSLSNFCSYQNWVEIVLRIVQTTCEEATIDRPNNYVLLIAFLSFDRRNGSRNRSKRVGRRSDLPTRLPKLWNRFRFILDRLLLANKVANN
jgi:hypothetical protein